MLQRSVELDRLVLNTDHSSDRVTPATVVHKQGSQRGSRPVVTDEYTMHRTG